MVSYSLIGLSLLLAVAALVATTVARARYQRNVAAVQSAGELFYRARDAEGALRAVEPLRAEPLWGHIAWSIRAYALRMVNRIDEAERETLAVLENARTTELPWNSYNTLVDTLTCAGRYEEALSVEGLIPARHRADALENKCGEYGLIQINLAEAEVNLGRPEAALGRLAHLDEVVASLPVAASGLGMQRAWILGVLGRGDEALAAVERCNREALGTYYAAEYHFSRTFALLASEGRLDEAEAELARARELAVRPSSTRNALFVAARIADMRGDPDGAERLCVEAAGHPHRWQGGDGLLFWGDLRARRGDLAGARAAWTRAIERDPQSASAREARERLVEHGGVPEQPPENRAPRAHVPPISGSFYDALATHRGLHTVLVAVPLILLALAAYFAIGAVPGGHALRLHVPRTPIVRGGAVLVEGGEFIMGSFERADEAPPRLGRISSFWLDQTGDGGPTHSRVVRGGEWSDSRAWVFRGAAREAGFVDRSDSRLGFRCAYDSGSPGDS